MDTMWKVKNVIARGCFVALTLSIYNNGASAQELDKIRLQYQNEIGVFTNIKEQLVISQRNGKLEASSNISKEKMLISDQSPSILNTEYIFHSYFNKLEEYDEEALIPGKNGYKKLKSSSSKTVACEQNNIFYDDSKQTEISFTGLTPGAVMRTNYTISHTDIHMLPAYYFQSNLPVVQSTFEVTAPKYVDMKFVVKGAEKDKVVQTRQENKNTVTYTFTASGLSTYKDYDDAPSSAWHLLHIVPYISSYQLPGKETTALLSDPAHLYTYFYDFIRHVNTKEDKGIADLVEDITRNDKSQEEKAAHIYQWVQQNIYYIAFEDSLEGFIPRQAADICKRKFGDCKDMASILVAMCRKAGIPAYFTWIGTRSKPYTYEETPLPIVDNHMICTIKLGDRWIFLDGTHPLMPFGEAPAGIQGKEAMISLDEKNFKILTVPEADETKNGCVDSTTLTINDRAINGKSSINYRGYMSWEVQTTLLYSKNKDRDQVVRQLAARGSNKYLQNNYEYTKSDTGKKDCKISANFSVGDYVQKVDKEYFVNMNIKRNLEGNHIDTQGRAIPYYYKYKDVQKEVVVLDIPSGYHVSYLPPKAEGKLKDLWDYTIAYTTEGSKVVLTKEYKFHTMTIPQESFAQHNKLIDELKKQYKETIVLTTD